MFAPWERGFDFTPPVPPPGFETGPPDFVGVGVQKAGTSWWYDLILEHPGVSRMDGIPKELHYFSHFAASPFGEREIDRYRGWFPRRPGSLIGEWTPDYLGYPWVPPLLARAAPEGKVLVILPDPVERFRSGLSYRLRQGAPDTGAAVADAVRQGFYARALRRLFADFDRDRVLVLQYEQCVDDPVAQLTATYRFLGLADHTPAELRRPVNVSGPKLPFDPEARRRIGELYRADVEDLLMLVPTLDLSLWTNFTALV
jgi:Sulfotransferase family